jgi:hypothetical protein
MTRFYFSGKQKEKLPAHVVENPKLAEALTGIGGRKQTGWVCRNTARVAQLTAVTVGPYLA